MRRALRGSAITLRVLVGLASLKQEGLNGLYARRASPRYRELLGLKCPASSAGAYPSALRQMS